VFGEQVSVLGTPKLNVNVGGTVLQATAVESTVASTEVKFVLTRLWMLQTATVFPWGQTP
jgi:hypothetical protein